jgi:hypothetical protein
MRQVAAAALVVCSACVLALPGAVRARAPRRCVLMAGEHLRLRTAEAVISYRRTAAIRGREKTIIQRFVGCAVGVGDRFPLGTSVLHTHLDGDERPQPSSTIGNALLSFDSSGDYVTFANITESNVLRSTKSSPKATIEEYDLATRRRSFVWTISNGNAEGNGLIALSIGDPAAPIPVASNGFAAWLVFDMHDPENQQVCSRLASCEEIIAHDSSGTHVVATRLPPHEAPLGGFTSLEVTTNSVRWSLEEGSGDVTEHSVPLA